MTSPGIAVGVSHVHWDGLLPGMASRSGNLTVVSTQLRLAVATKIMDEFKFANQ